MTAPEAKHTAGSWGVEDPMDHCLTIVANPEAPVHDWIWVATCEWPDEDEHQVTSAQVKANARLIAAAPELAAEAREVCAILDNHSASDGETLVYDYAAIGEEVARRHQSLSDAIAKSVGQ